jgi:hypothetical protein
MGSSDSVYSGSGSGSGNGNGDSDRDRDRNERILRAFCMIRID